MVERNAERFAYFFDRCGFVAENVGETVSCAGVARENVEILRGECFGALSRRALVAKDCQTFTL
ncbi:MAG: hypothetical protein ACXWMY_08670 [Vulcanimicrobiaceae bacterium]